MSFSTYKSTNSSWWNQIQTSRVCHPLFPRVPLFLLDGEIILKGEGNESMPRLYLVVIKRIEIRGHTIIFQGITKSWLWVLFFKEKPRYWFIGSFVKFIEMIIHSNDNVFEFERWDDIMTIHEIRKLQIGYWLLIFNWNRFRRKIVLMDQSIFVNVTIPE